MIKNFHQYYVYILSNKRNGTLYTGMTNNIERRILEHKQGIIKGFTKKYGLHMLVYFETHQSVNDAILREKRIKKWKREWKIEMIEKDNPFWLDLSNEWDL
ncbi:GIY-YIG nuclease family protein [Flagellimonas marinaquae]|jgi:putative endonuclease|uniref:GIY-YIG nuclease family protein n=1 Tax=Flagellimonas marinaquae TaxID=254955 RepID=UPI000F8CB00E|nr:GIY-YIG nuclease family protein [Allomuricauda aquimarina]